MNIYNHQTGAIVKTFEVSQVPVRCVRFIPRKNWFVTGSDDFQLRVFNYNTHDKVVAFEAHPDYIRCLAVHPTLPLVFTGSDDMTIKSWDWDKSWKCANVSPLACDSYDGLRLLLSCAPIESFWVTLKQTVVASKWERTTFIRFLYMVLLWRFTGIDGARHVSQHLESGYTFCQP